MTIESQHDGNATYRSRQSERGRGTVLEACRMRLVGRPAAEAMLVRTAREHPDFAASWLAHAIGSDAGADELALVLALARLHQEPALDGLHAFWSDRAGAGGSVPDSARARVESHGLVLDDRDAGVLGAILGLARGRPDGADRRPVANPSLPLKERWLAWLRRFAEPLLAPASVYGQQAGEQRQQVRDADQALMPLPSFHPLGASIERLIAWSCGRTLATAEPIVVLRYRPGQQYRWHRDYFQPGTPATDRELKNFGQRVHTGILYLNEDFSGGETEFRDWNLTLRPPPASVISFSGVDDDGNPDPASIHRGKPVEAGQKWIATLWFRDRPIWNRRGLLPG